MEESLMMVKQTKDMTRNINIHIYIYSDIFLYVVFSYFNSSLLLFCASLFYTKICLPDTRNTTVNNRSRMVERERESSALRTFIL